jgi:cytochrome c oxidase assembly protein Cox11
MMTQTQSNLLTMKKLLVVVLAMLAFGFALMPFYQKICEVTAIDNAIKAVRLRIRKSILRFARRLNALHLCHRS